MSKKISVIIPVYNVEIYLEKCVRSVMNQTFSNIEIILVDDGSTDNSGKICDILAQEDSRIVVIHQTNQGLSVARNTGINISRGDWIAFLDSDDWIEPNMYEILYNLSLKYDADIVSCKIRKIKHGETTNNLTIEDTEEILELNLDDMISGLLTHEVVRFEVWNKLWKKNLIGSTRFLKDQISEDVHFDRILFMQANKMIHIDKTLHNYLVMRPGSTGTSFKIGRLCIFDEYASWVKDLDAFDDKKMRSQIAYIAADSAIGLYVEATKTKQPKRILKLLYNKFKFFYKFIPKNQFPIASSKHRMKLFSISPFLFMFVRKIYKH